MPVRKKETGNKGSPKGSNRRKRKLMRRHSYTSDSDGVGTLDESKIHSYMQADNWKDAVNLFKRGRVFPNKKPMIFFSIYALILVALSDYYPPSKSYFPVGTLTPSSTVGLSFVMAFMVSFRLNECYGRWYEARKGWGRLVSVSNDICRLTSAYIAQTAEGGLENELVQKIFGLVIAFPIALTNNLRNNDEHNAVDLKTVGLSEDHYHSVLHAGLGNGRTWRWIVTLLSACIHEAAERGYITWEIVREMEQSVKEQTQTGGICCRIAETPLNYAVSIHVRSVLCLFFLMLPLACISNGLHAGWTLFIVIITLMVILTVDEIAVEMETPFGFDEVDLNLENYCNSIVGNTLMFARMDVSSEVRHQRRVASESCSKTRSQTRAEDAPGQPTTPESRHSDNAVIDERSPPPPPPTPQQIEDPLHSAQHIEIITKSPQHRDLVYALQH